MKKILTIITIAILALFVLSACGDDSSTGSDGDTNGDTDRDGGSSSGQTTWDLSALYGSSGSYKCTAKIESPQGSGDMVIWIKGNKERIEFTSQQEKSSMIFDGKKMY